MTPSISVILPVYNQKISYLKESIDSILVQSLTDFELIIIDDGSTNSDCINVLNEYAGKDSRIQLIRNEKNLGLIETLNKGLSLAKCEFIARMDSDDIAFPERLQVQADFLLNNCSYALIGASSIIIDQNGKRIGLKKSQTSDFLVKNTILMTNGFTHSTWMFRKNKILELGGYNKEANSVEDYDLLLRLLSKNKIINLPQTLLYHRINNDGVSWSNNKKQERQSINVRWKVYKKGIFPVWQIILFLPSLLFFCIPTRIKQVLILSLFR